MLKLEQACIEKGIKLTEQRRLILQVLADSSDHPDAEEICRRARGYDASISIPTVYRTVKLLEEAGIIAKHDFFGDGKSRYEELKEEHHDHLINIKTGEIVEFYSEELENLKAKIAEDLGYNLIDHRLELYAVPKD